MTNINKGQCACGNIEYQFTGKPVNSAFCYCKACQVHSGSDKFFGLWVPKDNFKFIKGTPTTFVRVGDSGKDVVRHFCADCGTTVSLDITVADMVSVAGSTLNESSKYSPQMAIYTASAPTWAVFPEGIPHFKKLPPQVE